jgi:hypothetical protein
MRVIENVRAAELLFDRGGRLLRGHAGDPDYSGDGYCNFPSLVDPKLPG